MEIKRKSNFEWLRIVAMAMIVSLHYMFKGNMVIKAADALEASKLFEINNIICALITALSICAVNVYVLISGYFLSESEFKPRRVLDLILQILEYSIFITIIMLITGQISMTEMSIYGWIGILFPIGSEEYWFITAYFVMYLLAPFLAAGVKSLSEKNLRIIIFILLGFFMVEKTILPMALPTDNYGYGFGWFTVLFLIAAYIRLYGINFLEKSKLMPVLTYFVSVVAMMVIYLLFGYIGKKSGIETLAYYSGLVWDYNYFFVLTAAVGLFYIFKNMKLNEDTKIADVARKLGGLTLGVYLLHEHTFIRYNWLEWMKVDRSASLGSILGKWILSILMIMICGLTVEAIRKKISMLLSKRR